MESTTFISDPESLRITGVVRAAADAAFRARIADALALRHLSDDPVEIRRRRVDENISAERWAELSQSTRAASSPEEFGRFSRALSVSARWLATGSGSPIDPPPSWHPFGTHVDRSELALELSFERDEALLPVWKRPRQLRQA